MNADHPLKHWVLLGPAGKRAGLRDQHIVASQIAAIRMTASGSGGGITSALLPKTEKELNRLQQLLNRGYTVESLPIRNNRAKAVREAVMDDSLIVRLVIYYEREKGRSPRAMKAINREFAIWVCDKLKDINRNNVRELIESRYPDLADRTSPDWWKKQLNQRTKQRKK